MSVEAPTEARRIAPAAQPEDADRAVAAAHAAEKALGAEPAPKPERSHSKERHDSEMERLKLHQMSVNSEALRAAIDAAVPLKQRAYDLGQVAEAASQVFYNALAGPEEEAARAAEAAADAEWNASRALLDAAALAVANAPFSDLHDVVARADAYGELVGRDVVEFPEDKVIQLGSYQAAIMEMIERQPGRGDWDDAVAELRGIERTIDDLDRRDTADLPIDAEVLRKAYAERDAIITDLLTMEPPHLDGLLVFMDLVFENDGPGARTYACRANAAARQVVSANALRNEEPDAFFSGLALLAQHTARLRDLEMPRDWREAMRDFGRSHPGAPDALRQAFDGCMHVPHLKAVWLSGRPEHELPVLVFGGPDGEHWATPDGVLKGGF